MSQPPKDAALVKLLLKNPVFANILMIALLAGGFFAAKDIVRESFPDISLDIIQVSIPYPGADPDDVEDGICKPLETALAGLSDTKRVFTVAAEGSGSAFIEVMEGKDPNEVKDEVKTLVDSVTVFPEEAEKPIISELNIEQDVLNVMVYGGKTERQLKEVSREIRDELENFPTISRVIMFGARPYELSIEVSEERLKQYGLTFSEVSQIVASHSLNLPVGTLKSSQEELKMRVFGERRYGPEFRNIPVSVLPDGTVRRLEDIASIRDNFNPDAEFYSLFNENRCIRLQIRKSDDQDAIEISKVVTGYLEMKRGELPEEIKLVPFFDVSRIVEDRLNLLKWNGLIGLLLVFFNLWLFLDLRLSFWVTCGIPISISGALLMMYTNGDTLNMISMFALIMVLGIIVDDAIVVGESIYFHRSQGLPSFKSATRGVEEVFWPVITAVLTTVVAFLPMFFIGGIMGKFIGVMPFPVVAALLISLVEALLILPIHLRHLPPVIATDKVTGLARYPARIRGAVAHVLNTVRSRYYRPLLKRLLDWRYTFISAVASVILIIVGLIMGEVVKYRFFPQVDGDFLMAQIEMPPGTPVEETERATRHLLAAWRKTEEEYKDRLKPYRPTVIKRVRSKVLSAREFDLGGDLKLARGLFSLVGGSQDEHRTNSGSHLSSIWVELMPAERRDIHFKEILKTWRSHAEPVPGAYKVTFPIVAGGPPGDNIQIELRGRDMDRLQEASEVLIDRLNTFSGVYDVESTFVPGKRELRITLKDSAHALGISLQDIAIQLRNGYYGNEVKRLQRDGDEMRIMLRYLENERNQESYLDDLRIKTRTGQMIPFYSLVNLERRPGYSAIRRENGARVITVKAEVEADANAADIQKLLMTTFLPQVADDYDITYGAGAEVQDRMTSIKTMMIGAVCAIVGIFLLMATVFKSYLQPFIITLTIPFGLAGAVVGHMVYSLVMRTDMPITFMSLMGMVALTGIVVNDSIVFIVAVNDRLKDGFSLFDSLLEAGQRRFRAIILTTLTTFIGLFPLLLEKSFQAQVLIPMAISVAAGVVFGTCATLLVIPCLLAVLNDLRRVWYVVRKLKWPSREHVELLEMIRAKEGQEGERPPDPSSSFID